MILIQRFMRGSGKELQDDGQSVITWSYNITICLILDVILTLTGLWLFSETQNIIDIENHLSRTISNYAEE